MHRAFKMLFNVFARENRQSTRGMFRLVNEDPCLLAACNSYIGILALIGTQIYDDTNVMKTLSSFPRGNTFVFSFYFER